MDRSPYHPPLPRHSAFQVYKSLKINKAYCSLGFGIFRFSCLVTSVLFSTSQRETPYSLSENLILSTCLALVTLIYLLSLWIYFHFWPFHGDRGSLLCLFSFNKQNISTVHPHRSIYTHPILLWLSNIYCVNKTC